MDNTSFVPTLENYCITALMIYLLISFGYIYFLPLEVYYMYRQLQADV